MADEVSLAKMKVYVIDGEERIVSTWKQGEGMDAEMVAIIADSCLLYTSPSPRD